MTKEEEKYTTLDTDQCKWWVNTLFNIAKEKACNSHNFDDGEEMQAAQDKIIKSLEIAEEFEKAQIITGGRLNGRTYAYKCGLEDGKRKALEQQPCEDCVSRDAIRLKIAEMPKYTDGRKTASIRHLEDFLEKEIEEPIEVTQDMCIGFTIALECIRDFITVLPTVTPTHGTCKDCRWLTTDEDGNYYCRQTGYFDSLDFYCKDFEKRGSENGRN